jgi:hypothetical protein
MISHFKFLKERARNLAFVVIAIILFWSILEVIHMLPLKKQFEHLHVITHACEKAVQVVSTVSMAILLFPATRLTLCGILVWSGLGLMLLGYVLANVAICNVANNFGLLLVAFAHLFLLKRELVKVVSLQLKIAMRRDSKKGIGGQY